MPTLTYNLANSVGVKNVIRRNINCPSPYIDSGTIVRYLFVTLYNIHLKKKFSQILDMVYNKMKNKNITLSEQFQYPLEKS